MSRGEIRLSWTPKKRDIAVRVPAVCALVLLVDASTVGAQEAGEVVLPPVEVSASRTPSPKKGAKRSDAAVRESVSPPAEPTETSQDANSDLTETTAGPVEGYRALTAVSATRSQTPLAELPQSIQVVPRSLIDDQTALSIDEAARNASGVTGTPRLQTPAYDSGKMRGFFSEQRLDGLPITYSPGHRDGIANIERIEVLKGPSAILSGGGLGSPVGGTLNVISKRPFDEARTEIGATVGSDKYYRPHFDINQPIAADGTALFRITGEYLDAGSFIDHIETEAYSINPTLTLAPNRDTTLMIQGHASRWEQPGYQGLPATGTVAGGFRIDRDMFIGATDASDSFSELQGVTVTLDHSLTPSVDATAKARWTRSSVAEIIQALAGSDGMQANVPLIGPSTWLLTNGYLNQEQDEFALVGDLRFRSSGRGWRNTVLVGADYSRISGTATIVLDAAFGGAGLVDLTNSGSGYPFVEPPKIPATTFMDEQEIVTTQGVYIQTQTTLADRLHLLGALRLADLTTDMNDYIDASAAKAHETRVLPRIGALVDLVDGLSAYANYSQGLAGYAIVGLRGLPDPQTSELREAGLKFDLGGQLSGTAALFQIDRDGTPIGVDTVIVGTSTERARGVELDVIWQPSRNWSVVGSYAYIDAKVLKADSLIEPGARRIGVPEHSGRLWANYAFDEPALKGWSVGAGLYAASGQPVDYANRFFTDSYLTVDAKLAYTTEDVTITGSVKNLLDEEYFISHYYLGGRVAPGDARAFYLTVSRTY